MAAPRSSDTGWRAWVALAILTFVYLINFLDRQLLSILAKPIQDELGITDGQIGLISGLYFALFYCVLAIPIAWLADRTNRVRVLSVACALWSAATTACGMAATYRELAVARMLVGVGEAGGVPPSYAIVTDYFPPGRRGTALSLFNLGPPLGMALGVAFGASIAAAFDWRSAFKAVGLVGVVAALLVAGVVRDPVRGGLDTRPDGSRGTPQRATFWRTCVRFFTHPVLLRTSIATAITQMVTYGSLNFTTLLLMREKGMTFPDVAIWYALVLACAITGGMLVSGRLIDRLAPRSKRAYGYLPAFGLTVALPFFIGFVAAPDWRVSLMCLAVPLFFNYFYLSPSVALVQETVRPQERVLAGALLLLVMNLVGLGLGPPLVGAVSDHLKPSHPQHSLQLAFYALVPLYLLAVLCFLWLARAFPREARSGVTA